MDEALTERVKKLEEDNAHIAAAFAALLSQLMEMWARHADMDQSQGNTYAANEWKAYAGRLASLLLNH